jgi:hypothetical protein
MKETSESNTVLAASVLATIMYLMSRSTEPPQKKDVRAVHNNDAVSRSRVLEKPSTKFPLPNVKSSSVITNAEVEEDHESEKASSVNLGSSEQQSVDDSYKQVQLVRPQLGRTLVSSEEIPSPGPKWLQDVIKSLKKVSIRSKSNVSNSSTSLSEAKKNLKPVRKRSNFAQMHDLAAPPGR